MTAKSPLENSPFENLEDTLKLNNKENEESFIENLPEDQNEKDMFNRRPANQKAESLPEFARTTIFSDLKRLENALLTDNHEVIQELLPKLDKSINRLIEVRTTIGSSINKIDNAIMNVEKEEIINEGYKSRIEDADVAELFTDLTRQKNVLNATYKASAQMMNNNLMNFIN